MRVAIVAGPFIPVPPINYGGTELIINHLIKGLKELGHEPVLLGSGDSKADCEIIPIVDKPLYFPSSTKELPDYQKLVDKTYRYTRKKLRQLLPYIDIINSHGFDLKEFRNFPNITTIHGPILLDQLDYYRRRSKLYYISISKNQQAAYPDLKWVSVIYDGEDPQLFPLVEKPDNYVCFLGRFDREKNPHLAIQLAINLGIKIKVAGKIDYLGEGYFDEEVRPYLNHPLVEYLGELGFKEKTELLSRAKCNLHPTGFREPFGLDVLEAAYCGTPTLAIARGSMPELIEEGKTGMLVEDFTEGYHQIKACFEMDRRYIAKRSRAMFNYKTMTRQYINAYYRVLEVFENRREYSKYMYKMADMLPAKPVVNSYKYKQV